MSSLWADAAGRVYRALKQAPIQLPRGRAMNGLEQCIGFGALRPDLAIGAETLLVVEPFAVEAALMAEQEANSQLSERKRALELERQQPSMTCSLLPVATRRWTPKIVSLPRNSRLVGTRRFRGCRSARRGCSRVRLEVIRRRSRSAAHALEGSRGCLEVSVRRHAREAASRARAHRGDHRRR